MILDDRNFIALPVHGSLSHSHIIIHRHALEFVRLSNSDLSESGIYILYLDLIFSSKEISISFDATTNLQDGLDLYRELMLQLGFPSSIARQDSSVLVPPQLRHLLPTQPEIVNRP